MKIVNSKIYFFLRNSMAYIVLQPIWRWYYQMCGRYAMRKHARELLESIKLVLDENNILFWLDFGTLLGAYREKGFISHDCDLDIGVMYEDAERVKEILAKSPFRLTHQYQTTNSDEIVQLSFEYKSLSIDICFYHKENNTLFCYLCSIYPGVSIVRNKKCKVAISKCIVPYSGFTKLDFQNSTYSVPSNTCAYLSAHYGPNFMIPDSGFDYTKDAPNITKYPIEEKWGLCFYNE